MSYDVYWVKNRAEKIADFEHPTLEGVRSPRSGIVKDTVQCRDRFAELDYQRLIGRVHSLSSFPFFAFSHLSRAARHSSNVGLTQENNSLSMGWR